MMFLMMIIKEDFIPKKTSPARVSHVKYKDMVNDIPGIASAAVISSTGLSWEPDVLNFHKKNK